MLYAPTSVSTNKELYIFFIFDLSTETGIFYRCLC